jgi:uncharacterized protein (TIGR02996 family)
MEATDLADLVRALCANPHDRVRRRVFADALEESGQNEQATTQRLLTERFVYYLEGRFSNVYQVYVVPESQADRFNGLFPNADRIDRQRAVYWGVNRPRQAKRDNEWWSGGFVEDGSESPGGSAGMPNPYSTDVRDMILLAADATLGAMEYKKWSAGAAMDY